MPAKLDKSSGAVGNRPPITKSVPEVFIIESLGFDDEEDHLFEGQVLADVLRMCGKTPRYYYFRTRAELIALAAIYAKSGFRYLHVSCHGGSGALHTTLGDSILYTEFAEVFRDKLKNRRLFVSACDTSRKLCDAVAATNKGMYSVAASTTDIEFSHAVALWSAFYVRAFSISETGMKESAIQDTLSALCSLFEVKLVWSHYAAEQDTWRHRRLG